MLIDILSIMYVKYARARATCAIGILFYIYTSGADEKVAEIYDYARNKTSSWVIHISRDNYNPSISNLNLDTPARAGERTYRMNISYRIIF